MKISFASVLVFAFSVALLAPATVQAQAQTKNPNILIIWGDDIGFWNVSDAGDK